MYLGLTRRGLESMMLFLASVAIPSWVGLEVIGAIVGIPLWFYFFFETFATRTRLEEGETIPDEGYWNVFAQLGETKFVFIGGAMVVIGLLALINNISSDLAYLETVGRYAKEYLPAVLLIGFGVYLLARGKRKNQEEQSSDDISEVHLEE